MEVCTLDCDSGISNPSANKSRNSEPTVEETTESEDILLAFGFNGGGG